MVVGIACTIMALYRGFYNGTKYLDDYGGWRDPWSGSAMNGIGHSVTIVAFAILPLAACTCWKLDRYRGLVGLIGAVIALLFTFVFATQAVS